MPCQKGSPKSAELLRRKQQQNESVDDFAQDFEALFERSYGQAGMDEEARERLKRDLFVQGLQYRWQEKVLPTATTFCDALYQARANEEQAKQLSHLQKHHESRGSSRGSSQPRATPYAQASQSSGSGCGGRVQPQSVPPPPLSPPPRRDRLPPLKGVMRGLVVDDGSKVPVLIGALKAVEIVTVATTTGGIAHNETLHLKRQDNPKRVALQWLVYRPMTLNSITQMQSFRPWSRHTRSMHRWTRSLVHLARCTMRECR